MASFRFFFAGRRAGRASLALPASAAIAGGAWLFAACGGAAVSPLDEAPTGFSNNGGSDASVTGSGSGGDASSGGQPGSSGPGSGNGNPGGGGSSGGGADASPKTDSGGSSSSSGGDDAGPGTGGDDSAAPSPVGIPCGTGKPCAPGSKVCCVTPGGGGGPPNFQCTSLNDCDNQNGLSVTCASNADCIAAGNTADTVCCVTEQSGVANAGNVSCLPSSQCGGQNQAWMCNPADPQCPTGDKCTTSTVTIPPYSICTP